jgi:tetratricopeptide (TPR) repeat protein
MGLLPQVVLGVCAAACALLPRQARAEDPWTIRPDPVARGGQLLKLLEAAPDSDEGFQAIVSTLGLQRAATVAEAHSQTARTWQACYIAGRLWLMAGKPAPAERAFVRALGLGRTARKLLGWIGEELIRAGRVRPAEALLRQWEKRRPEDADALAILSRIALARRDLKGALQVQRRLAELQPKNAQVRLVYARLLHQEGSIETAVKEYEAAAKAASSDAQLECQLLLEEGSLLEVLERFDEAVKLYRRGLKLTARGGWAHRELSQRILMSFERRGAFAELMQEARNMLKDDPRSLLALHVLATRSAKSGKLGDAIGYYERYLKGAPGDNKARAELVFLHMRAGKLREAVPHARELHRRNPSDSRQLIEYATLLTQTGQQDEARRALRAGVALYGQDADGLQLIAAALDTLNDREGSKRALDALLKLDGATSKSYRVAVGRFLWQRGRRGEALAAWARVVSGSASRIDYEQWVEVILSEEVVRDSASRATLVSQTRAGLARFPGHPALLSLKRQLGI